MNQRDNKRVVKQYHQIWQWFLALWLGSLLPSLAMSEQPEPQVCLYEHFYFQGWKTCFTANQSHDDLRELGINDQVSSMEIFGAIQIELYEHIDYQGEKWTYTESTPWLGDNANDKFSSIRVLARETSSPIAIFTTNLTFGSAPLTITVDASNSSDDGYITNYQWDTSDGQFASGQKTNFTFDIEGNYTITLTVTDNQGLTAVQQQSVEVSTGIGTGYELYFDGQLVGHDPTWTYEQSLENLVWNTEQYPQINVQGWYNGKVIPLPLGYELYFDGQRVGHAPTWTYEKAVENLLWNKQQYPDIEVQGYYNGEKIVIPSGYTPILRIEPTELYFDDTSENRSSRSAEDIPSGYPKVAGDLELFKDATQQVDNVSSDSINRLKYVWVNLRALSVKLNSSVAYAEKVILNLFPDVSYTAINSSIIYRSEGNYTWIGKIEGIPYSTVTLVISQGKVTGDINAVEGGFYQIRPTENGLHFIQLMDFSIIPQSVSLKPLIDTEEVKPSLNNEELRSPQQRTLKRGDVIIDVMVVYTPAAAQLRPDIASEIQLAIDQTNQAYVDSGIHQKLSLAHVEQVNYVEEGNPDIERLAKTNDGFLDDVHRLRDIYQADLVSLWVHDQNPPYGGVGYLMQTQARSKDFAPWGFNVIERKWATAYVFAHELGHNMGAHHDWYVAKDPGAYDYSHGFIHDTGSATGSWRTIMAYDTQCNNKGYSCAPVGYFSNPNITYQGFATGDSFANNGLTLNNTAEIVASFRTGTIQEEVKTFTIFNDGNANLAVSNISIEDNAAWISVYPTTITVSPNTSVSVTVKVNYSLAPIEKTTSHLLVFSNDSNSNPHSVNVVVNHQAITAKDEVYSTSFDAVAGTLSLNVGVFGSFQELDIYQVFLDLMNPYSMVFELNLDKISHLGAITDSNSIPEKIATYQPQTGTLEIPTFSTFGELGEPLLYQVEMQQSDGYQFEVTEMVPIEVQAIE